MMGVKTFMDDIEIIEYEEMDLSNCLPVVAFPTVGLISSIAGQFIIDTLKLKEIAWKIARARFDLLSGSTVGDS